MTTSPPRRAFPPVTEVLPHAPPMVLLDEIVAHDARGVVCTVRITERSPFAVAGRVPSSVALEYIAQAIAAYAGLRSAAAGGRPHIGYLVGARELTFHTDGFSAGDELRVEVSHVWGDDALGSFQGCVVRAGRVVAAGTLNVHRPDLAGPAPVVDPTS